MNKGFDKKLYPYEGKYDAITCDGFGKGSSYKTIYGKGDKALQAYIRGQNQGAYASRVDDEELQDLQPAHRRGWAAYYQLPMQAVPPEAKPPSVLPGKGENEDGVLKH